MGRLKEFSATCLDIYDQATGNRFGYNLMGRIAAGSGAVIEAVNVNSPGGHNGWVGLVAGGMIVAGVIAEERTYHAGDVDPTLNDRLYPTQETGSID